MHASENMLNMFAQELIGAHLCEKSRTNDTNGSKEFCDGEYAALVRGTAYAIGAGKVYGFDGRWRAVCEDIREAVRTLCLGFNNDNVDRDDVANMVGDLRHLLDELSKDFRS